MQTTWALEAFGHSEEAQRRLKAAVKDDPDHPLNQADTAQSMFITETVVVESKDVGETKENPSEDKEADAKAEEKPDNESKAESKSGAGSKKAETKKGEEFHVGVGPVVTVNE